MSWKPLANWWLEELANDSAYEEVVTPLLVDVLRPVSGALYVDLGCGEGRLGRALEPSGAIVIGIDLSQALVEGASTPSAVADFPATPFRSDSIDGAFAVLLLEHLEDHSRFFEEASRVVKAGGTLCIVSNHPIWTAPESTPIEDTDGEILWRPGSYFSSGSTDILVDGGTVTFHHRSMAELLNAAAAVGWSLETMIESPHHELAGQGGIPRLVACRWRLLP